MIQVIRADERFVMEAGWLKAHWHFSFGDYYDPRNIRWGALRVFNDDYIKPNSGFPMHPHDNMEIITYVIDGELTHRDSLGNLGVIRPGEIQRMTAGTGVVHSEYNNSPDQQVHLVQMWVMPNQRGLEPSWEQKRFTQEDRQGKLLPVVSSHPVEGALHMHQDATFYISSLAAGNEVAHKLGEGRHAYLFVIDGEVTLNGQTLHKADQARIKQEDLLTIKATEASELVLWDTI